MSCLLINLIKSVVSARLALRTTTTSTCLVRHQFALSGCLFLEGRSAPQHVADVVDPMRCDELSAARKAPPPATQKAHESTLAVCLHLPSMPVHSQLSTKHTAAAFQHVADLDFARLFLFRTCVLLEQKGARKS